MMMRAMSIGLVVIRLAQQFPCWHSQSLCDSLQCLQRQVLAILDAAIKGAMHLQTVSKSFLAELQRLAACAYNSGETIFEGGKCGHDAAP